VLMSIYHIWMPTWNDYFVEFQMATHEYQNNIPHETKKMWFECKPQHMNQTPPNTPKSHTMHISKQHRCNTTQHSNIWKWIHQIQIVDPIGSANSLELPQQPFTICLTITNYNSNISPTIEHHKVRCGDEYPWPFPSRPKYYTWKH
jgi:hypothetical protein